MKKFYDIWFSKKSISMIDIFRSVSNESRSKWLSRFLTEAVKDYPLRRG